MKRVKQHRESKGVQQGGATSNKKENQSQQKFSFLCLPKQNTEMKFCPMRWEFAFFWKESIVWNRLLSLVLYTLCFSLLYLNTTYLGVELW